MKVKLKKVWRGPRGNHGEGCVVDMDEPKAKRMIARGEADPAEKKPSTPKRKTGRK